MHLEDLLRQLLSDDVRVSVITGKDAISIWVDNTFVTQVDKVKDENIIQQATNDLAEYIKTYYQDTMVGQNMLVSEKTANWRM